MNKFSKIKRLWTFSAVASLCFLMSFAVYASSNADFTPRWSIAIDNYNGYYELTNEDLATVYSDIDRFNAIYDQHGDGVYDVGFYPDVRAKRFYEITPYTDSYGRPIADDDTVKKVIMELRYLLNGNSMIKLADDGIINAVLNVMPKQDTNVLFARTSDTPFFKKTSNLCLISYNPQLDKDWAGRKEFLGDAKLYASQLKFYEDVPDLAWRNFLHHLRAAMCVNPEIASWITEPPGLVMDIDKTTRKNKAFSFAFTFAVIASARDGYPMLLPKFTEIFKNIEESEGIPVFKMKLFVADLNPKSGKIKTESNIAYPFTPYEILRKAGELDYMSYPTAADLSAAIFQIALDTEFNSEDINSRWMTEEFITYRMGF